jgi:hypothetical protein
MSRDITVRSGWDSGLVQVTACNASDSASDRGARLMGRGPRPGQDRRDALDAGSHAQPTHLVRFREQDNIQGLLAGTPGAVRAIGYLCKYLTKSIAQTHDDGDAEAARVAHIDRLAEEARSLPCAPTCANWLRYGVQPARRHRRAGPGALHPQGPRPGQPRTRRPAGTRVPQVVRQDPRRPQGRPRRRRARGPRRGRDRPRRPRRDVRGRLGWSSWFPPGRWRPTSWVHDGYTGCPPSRSSPCRGVGRRGGGGRIDSPWSEEWFRRRRRLRL